jgi:hypothetical protein
MKKRIVKSQWLRWTEASNALDNLQTAQDFLRQVDNRPMAWKWVILSLHDALYGFMICALMGTNPDNVTYPLRDKEGKEILDKQSSLVRRLINFRSALKRCRKDNSRGIWLRRHPLKTTPDQKHSVERLQKQFRNTFAHYQPSGWSIELFIMPDMIGDVLAVLRSLVIDTNAIVHLHLTEKEKKQLKSLLYQCPRVLKRTQIYRDVEDLKIGTARVYQRPTRSKKQIAFNAVLEDFEEQQALALAENEQPSGFSGSRIAVS